LILVDLPDASAFAPGPYWWFAIVDSDSDGVPGGEVSDIVLTLVAPD
jgi:hypothetical protein